MSKHATLKADKRTATGKGAARKLRASGRVPAVVYGQGGEAIEIILDAAETDLLFHRISTDNTIVDLTVEGEGKSFQTLVREIQVHPFRPDILHVDFYRVQKGVKVDVEIPVHLNGTPIGVKNEGGILQQVVHELPVQVMPSLIPESFEIDVSHLEMGQSILVSDLTLPEGVDEIGLDPDQTICAVVAPRVQLDEDEEGDEGEPGEAPEPELIGGAEGDDQE